eukprot:3823012-Prymnesium_polylepis.1
MSGTHCIADPSDTNCIAYRATLKANYGAVTPTNGCKMNALRPDAERVSYEACDHIFNWAGAQHMLVRGHTLIWHESNPTWLAAAASTTRGAEVTLRAH